MNTGKSDYRWLVVLATAFIGVSICWGIASVLMEAMR